MLCPVLPYRRSCGECRVDRLELPIGTDVECRGRGLDARPFWRSPRQVLNHITITFRTASGALQRVKTGTKPQEPTRIGGNRQTEASRRGKLSAVSHCSGDIASRWVVSETVPRRVCSADLFNKSIGRQSYSCGAFPYRPDIVGAVRYRVSRCPRTPVRRPCCPVCLPRHAAFSTARRLRVGSLLLISQLGWLGTALRDSSCGNLVPQTLRRIGDTAFSVDAINKSINQSINQSIICIYRIGAISLARSRIIMRQSVSLPHVSVVKKAMI